MKACGARWRLDAARMAIKFRDIIDGAQKVYPDQSLV